MRRRNIPLVCAILLIVSMLACNLPSTATPAVTEVEPPLETEAPPATTEPPTAISEPPTAEPPPDPLVVVHQGDNFHIFALDGALVETRSATGMATWAHPNSYQVVGDAIYYVDSGGAGLGGNVKRVTAAGVEDLAFTAVPGLAILKFAVSDDQSMIAWAAGEWGNSELWTSDINGGGAQLIIQSDPSHGLEDFYVLETYRWTVDGDLLFSWQISGIGNLAYFGYSSMYHYSPATGEITALYDAPASGGMPCWSIVSPDGLYLVGACIGESEIPGVREREVSTGIETVLPLLPNQDQSGSAAYSPSGSRLAYAYVRGGMDDIDGYIAVRLNPGGDPQSIASVLDGSFRNIYWIDEDRLVVQGSEADVTGVYLLTIDGVLTPIAEGEMIGLMWP